MTIEGARTYLKTHKISGKQLHFRLREEMEGELERAREARTGRTSRDPISETGTNWDRKGDE